MYLDALPSDPNQPFKGHRLDPELIEKVIFWMMQCLHFSYNMGVQMSAEQIGQLYELMHATKDVWKPLSPAEDDSAEKKQL